MTVQMGAPILVADRGLRRSAEVESLCRVTFRKVRTQTRNLFIRSLNFKTHVELRGGHDGMGYDAAAALRAASQRVLPAISFLYVISARG